MHGASARVAFLCFCIPSCALLFSSLNCAGRKRQREAILHKRQHAERVKDETQRLYEVRLGGVQRCNVKCSVIQWADDCTLRRRSLCVCLC